MKHTSLILQVGIGLVIGVLAMLWALQGSPIHEVVEEMHKANLMWSIPTAILFLIQQLIRAYRQQLLLTTTHPEHNFRTSLAVLCIGFFFINTLPARMGEFARPLLLQAKEDIPLGIGIAVVFTERIIDLIAALLIFIGVLAFADIRIVASPWLTQAQQFAAYCLPFLLLMLTVVIFASHWLAKIFAFSTTIQNSLLHFSQSMQALRQGKHLSRIIFLTIITWGLTGWMYVTAAMAFNVSDLIGYVEGMGLLAFTMLGMAVPNAPGFAGAYEASFVAGLEVFGLRHPQQAFAMAFAFHWWIFIVQAATAIYFLATDRIRIRNLLGQLYQQRRNSKA